jgi:hypothetical protein
MSQNKNSALSKERTVEADLQLWVARTNSRLLCTAILNAEIKFFYWVLRLRFLKKEDSFASTTFVAVCLAGILYALTILIGRGWGQSVAIWNPATLFVSSLIAFSLSLVKRLHDTILSSDQNNNVATMLIMAVRSEDKALKALRDWWKTFLSLRLQITSVMIFGLLAIWMLHQLRLHSHVEIHAGSYFLIFFLGIAIGQGAYCALVIPTLATVLRKMSVTMFWLYPSDTRWVKKISSVFTKLSLANAFIGTCIMVGMLWFKPWESFTTAGIAALGLIGTWSVVLYSFVYPHFQLGKALKAEQLEQMGKLQKVIDLKSLTAAHSESETKKLNEIIKIYEKVASARASAVDMQAIFRLVFSLGIPMLTFLGVLVELGKHVSDFMKGTEFSH